MRRKTTSNRKTAPVRRDGHAHAGHSKSRCLKILRRLSSYLDNELAPDLCREIRQHLGACPNCEVFVDSLRQTVALCRHVEAPPLTASEKVRLRSQILRAANQP